MMVEAHGISFRSSLEDDYPIQPSRMPNQWALGGLGQAGAGGGRRVGQGSQRRGRGGDVSRWHRGVPHSRLLAVTSSAANANTSVASAHRPGVWPTP